MTNSSAAPSTTQRHSSYDASRRVRRGLKPRRAVPLDFGPVATTSDREVESRLIARANRNRSPAELQVTDGWAGSSAQELLQPLSGPGLWIPTWAAQAAGHPVRSRLLAWVLDRFEDVDATTRQCRARIIDEQGQRWWDTSVARAARYTLLGEKAVDRGLKQLASQGLIQRLPRGSSGTLLRPLARSLIREYVRHSGDTEAEKELTFEDQIEWYGSLSRSAAMGRVAGVRVPDILMLMCNCQPGPAMLLSHVLYWHSNGRPRISRNGHLWCAKSWRTLEQELGHGRKAVDGWRKLLVELGLIDCRYWVWDHRRDRGRKTLHIRPLPSAIEKAITVYAGNVQNSSDNEDN